GERSMIDSRRAPRTTDGAPAPAGYVRTCSRPRDSSRERTDTLCAVAAGRRMPQSFGPRWTCASSMRRTARTASASAGRSSRKRPAMPHMWALRLGARHACDGGMESPRQQLAIVGGQPESPGGGAGRQRCRQTDHEPPEREMPPDGHMSGPARKQRGGRHDHQTRPEPEGERCICLADQVAGVAYDEVTAGDDIADDEAADHAGRAETVYEEHGEDQPDDARCQGRDRSAGVTAGC